jgi:hypothetical protein
MTKAPAADTITAELTVPERTLLATADQVIG